MGRETDMHAGRLKRPLERLRRALAPADGGDLSDGRLLARFVATRDESAFAALVRRHGPMVLGVCRRLVRHDQDAEDCFQAAFLVLAQRAGSIRSGSLAAWLYGVAYRVCLRCRRAGSRRSARERQVERMPQPEVAPAEPQDWRPLLDQELMALPEKYRAAVVLCDLEGKARREAARLLRVPEGTLSSRLARARALLAWRLSRRGVALSGGAVAATLAGGAATAAVPAQLVVSTAKVAALVAAGQSAAVGSQAALLMHEVQRGMLMAKLKVGAALAAAAVLLGAGGFAYRAAGQDRSRPVKSGEVRAPADMELLRKEVELLKLQVELLQEKVRAQGIELRELKGQAGRGAPRAGLNAPPAGGLPTGVAPAAPPAAGNAPPALRPTAPAAGAPAAPPAPEGAVPSLAPSAAPPATPPAAGSPPPTLCPAAAPSAGAPTAPTPLPPEGALPPDSGGVPAARPTAPLAPPLDLALTRGTTPGAEAQPDAVGRVEAALKALRQARDPEARRRATDALEKAVKQLRGQPPGGAAPPPRPQPQPQ
jgi:RNA polymerase sigma factor (sigma-70 family)